MSNKKITLPWMNVIRERIKEIEMTEEIEQFIKPIIEYGESEEKRINEGFEERSKKLNEVKE